MGRYRIFCWGAIANLVLATAAQGQTAPIEVHLAWDPSPDTNVAGYYIYIGPRSGFYTSRIDVGNVTNATFGNLSSGTYYFIASAYSPDRVESLPSNEVNGFWTKLDMKLGADQFMHLNFLVTSNRLFDLQVTSTFSN